MELIRKEVLGIATMLWLTGCAMHRYTPVPIAPAATALRFESRSLADAGLRSFEEKNLGHPLSPWPPERWDLQTLSLAALNFNPALSCSPQHAAGLRQRTAEPLVISGYINLDIAT
jgi:hypothetical protein